MTGIHRPYRFESLRRRSRRPLSCKGDVRLSSCFGYRTGDSSPLVLSDCVEVL